LESPKLAFALFGIEACCLISEYIFHGGEPMKGEEFLFRLGKSAL